MRFCLFLALMFLLPFVGHSYVPELDVVYDTVGGVPLKMDVFRSSKKVFPPTPALVYLHGGCFSMGSKRDIAEDIKRLADEGLTVFSVDYRLAPSAPYPAAIDDVRSAVRFLRKNAAGLGLDPKRISVHGESAGGYLAAILGLRLVRDRSGNIDEFSDPVQFVSDWFGRTDFTATQTTGTDCAEVFLGKKRTPETLQEFHLASATAVILKKTAKFLIIHGSRDQQVYPFHSTKLSNRLMRSGNDVELYFYEGGGHGFPRAVPWEITRQAILRASGLPVSPKENARNVSYQLTAPSALRGIFDLDLILGNKDRVPVILNGKAEDFREGQFSGKVGVIAGSTDAALEIKTKDPSDQGLIVLETTVE